MDRNYDVIISYSLLQNTFVLRRPRVAIFSEIIKIITMFTEKIFKDSKKFQKTEIMYQNAILSAFPDFWWKNADVSRTQGVCHVIYMCFVMTGKVRYDCASFIIVGYCVTVFREGPLFAPHPSTALKRTILNRVKVQIRSKYTIQIWKLQNCNNVLMKGWLVEKSWNSQMQAPGWPLCKKF